MKNEIRAVLTTVNYDKVHLDRLIEAFKPSTVYHFDRRDETGIRSVLEEIDVAVLDSDLDDLILEAPNVRWIHCSHAGLDSSARPEVFRRGIIVTGAAGRSAPSLAEHVFFFILSFTYDVYRLHEAQIRQDWRGVSQRYSRARGLSGRVIGIIGLGNTGRAVARRAKAFDMRVLAYSRSMPGELPDNVDEMYALDNGDVIDRLLAESDFLVLCCRLTDETYHMLGKREFEAMKNTAYLINMARGAVVDEQALYHALQNAEIAGAGCDVFEIEPLPEDSPLWTLPNIMITPHSTPRVADIYGNALDILCDNIGCYRRGEEMKNRLSQRDIYTKQQSLRQEG